jgi:hypothetical protein
MGNDDGVSLQLEFTLQRVSAIPSRFKYNKYSTECLHVSDELGTLKHLVASYQGGLGKQRSENGFDFDSSDSVENSMADRSIR